MSVTSDILRILADGGKGMDEAILVARAMERGDDARRVFNIVEIMGGQDRSPEDRAAILVIFAEAVIKENEHSRQRFTRQSDYIASSGPKERWGYDGPITPRLAERDWWPLRAKILERDNHTCRYCEERPERMCVDHVIPLSRGGSNDEDNLVACCLPCNSSKSDKLLSEWEGRIYA